MYKDESVNFDKNILDKLVNKWFTVMSNDEINEELLFLEDMELNMDEIKKALASNASFRNKYQILDVDSYIRSSKWKRGPKNIGARLV